MKLITLHDHLNPNQEVEIDADQIASITAFGSGSAIQCGGGTVGVHETPREVMKAINDATS